IIHQDLGVEPVIVYEFNSDSVPVPLSWQDCHEQQAEALSEKVAQLRGSDRTAVARAALYELHPGESAALVLYLGDLSGDKKEIELPGMVYQSIAMRALVDEINKIRGSTVTVLVTGESGTGKEV